MSANIFTSKWSFHFFLPFSSFYPTYQSFLSIVDLSYLSTYISYLSILDLTYLDPTSLPTYLFYRSSYAPTYPIYPTYLSTLTFYPIYLFILPTYLFNLFFLSIYRPFKVSSEWKAPQSRRWLHKQFSEINPPEIEIGRYASIINRLLP